MSALAATSCGLGICNLGKNCLEGRIGKCNIYIACRSIGDGPGCAAACGHGGAGQPGRRVAVVDCTASRERESRGF